MNLLHSRIAVVGSGAVGCYYGGRLARIGCDVHFLVRGEIERAVLRQAGLRIQSGEGGFSVQNVHVHATTQDIGPCDLVLIALKATANHALPDLIPPLLKPGTLLLTLQNGLGNEESLAEQFPDHSILGGLCFVCLNKLEPGVIDHLGYGNLALGDHGHSPRPATHAIASVFQQSGVDTRVAADLAAERWRKLVWNIPFNGLTVLGTAMGRSADHPFSVADVLADDAFAHLALRLMEEVIRAANRLGHDIPMDFAAVNMKRTAAMGAYQPSSLLDYIAGRPLEIEAIWGEPYRRASNAGAETGRLETLYHLLRSLQR